MTLKYKGSNRGRKSNVVRRKSERRKGFSETKRAACGD